MSLKEKKCECCGTVFYGKIDDILCVPCRNVIFLIETFNPDIPGIFLEDRVKKIWEQIQRPEWDEASKIVHDWRNHIPQGLKDKWFEFTDEARLIAFMFASNLADAKE